jgi:hypothetical protein
MSQPTQQDAALMLQAAQWGAQMGLGEANRNLFRDDFDPETADIRDEHVSTVLVFGETIGTLVKHDLISNELIQDWLWVEGMWGRVGPAALKAREASGESRLYENFEALAGSGG